MVAVFFQTIKTINNDKMKQWGLTPLFHFCGWKFVKGLDCL